MARLKLSDPSQPIYVRTVLGIYEFFASLKLAVVLILSLACLLGVATFVEANYGTAAVGFLIYHTWFFAALLALLATNIFCAASIRFPWKRHQTGFVVTHIGLLTLLTGSAISDRGSVNSQMLVFLGQSNHVAIDMDQSTLNIADIPGHPHRCRCASSRGPSTGATWPPTPSCGGSSRGWDSTIRGRPGCTPPKPCTTTAKPKSKSSISIHGASSARPPISRSTSISR